MCRHQIPLLAILSLKTKRFELLEIKMKICVAGAAGAFGTKHLDALEKIDGVEVTSIVGRVAQATAEFAKSRNIGHSTTDLAESLSRDDVDAVILATPTQV